jgi:CRISPR-associated protein Cas1
MPAWEPIGGQPLLLHPERLQTLLIYGHGDLTGAALRLLWQHGVQVSFVSRHGGRLQGRLSPPSDAAPQLAYLQHLAAGDSQFALGQARGLVEQKVAGIRDVLAHLARHGHAELLPTRELLKIDLRRIAQADSLPSLLGHEGSASARWHAILRTLFPEPMPYPGRRCHPATDPVNALLSLGYTLLLSRVQAYAAAIGLDPLIGVYHQRRAGKPALACDLIEPLRTPLVDQLVLAQVRQGVFRPEHFCRTEQGVRLQPAEFRRFLQVFEARYGGEPRHATFQQQARQTVDQFAAAVRQWARGREV